MVSQNHQGLSLLWLSSDPSAPSFMEHWALYSCFGQKDRGWWQSSLLQCRLTLDTYYCKEKDAVIRGARREGGRETQTETYTDTQTQKNRHRE